jgi:dimethylaniline monooxygenase (N-oxide forming)
MDQGEHVPFFDVIIVGAGWSGLLACKYCVGEGLKTLVLESRDSFGGVWSFTEDRRFGGVMTTTQTTSSRCITEMSDFPMPESYPDFPSHIEIITYLKAFCSEFDLERYFRFGRHVSRAQKIDGVWCITLADGSTYKGKNIIVCSGVHQHQNTMSDDADRKSVV